MPAVLVQGHCYAELAVSSLEVAKTTASTHCVYHGGMARLSRQARHMRLINNQVGVLHNLDAFLMRQLNRVNFGIVRFISLDFLCLSWMLWVWFVATIA